MRSLRIVKKTVNTAVVYLTTPAEYEAYTPVFWWSLNHWTTREHFRVN